MVAGGFVLGIVNPARSGCLSHVGHPSVVESGVSAKALDLESPLALPAEDEKEIAYLQLDPVLHPPARRPPQGCSSAFPRGSSGYARLARRGARVHRALLAGVESTGGCED